MKPRSLAIRTDLFFLENDGVVTDRGDYLVIETPGNPTYYSGNMLIFDRPPGVDDVERWPALFERELGHEPRIEHVKLRWDSPEGELGAAEQLAARGYRLTVTEVLSTERVTPPPRPNREVDLRPIESESDWRQMIDLDVLTRESTVPEGPYRAYLEPRIAAYRRLIDAGKGFWMGAFLDGTLVASMGLFDDGEVGRFQSVVTHPDYRRRGICGTLVHATATRGVEQLGLGTLVMVAEAVQGDAARIYRSVGFEPRERDADLCLLPRQG